MAAHISLWSIEAVIMAAYIVLLGTLTSQAEPSAQLHNDGGLHDGADPHNTGIGIHGLFNLHELVEGEGSDELFTHEEDEQVTLVPATCGDGLHAPPMRTEADPVPAWVQPTVSQGHALHELVDLAEDSRIPLHGEQQQQQQQQREGGDNADDELSRPPLLPGPVHEYCIIGAGPAGLQIGYFLHRAKRDYVIVERGNNAGSFFSHYPRHRTMLSRTHHCDSDGNDNSDDPMDACLRIDEHSLILEKEDAVREPTLRMAYFTSSVQPTGKEYASYLREFARRSVKDRSGLRIAYNTTVERIYRLWAEHEPSHSSATQGEPGRWARRAQAEGISEEMDAMKHDPRGVNFRLAISKARQHGDQMEGEQSNGKTQSLQGSFPPFAPLTALERAAIDCIRAAGDHRTEIDTAACGIEVNDVARRALQRVIQSRQNYRMVREAPQAKHATLDCKYIVVATGTPLPVYPHNVEGLEHVHGYESLYVGEAEYNGGALNQLFVNKSVVIFGNGNSAMEVANQAVQSRAARVHVIGIRPIQFSFMSHYRGDVSARNAVFLDEYPFGSSSSKYGLFEVEGEYGIKLGPIASEGEGQGDGMGKDDSARLQKGKKLHLFVDTERTQLLREKYTDHYFDDSQMDADYEEDDDSCHAAAPDLRDVLRAFPFSEGEAEQENDGEGEDGDEGGDERADDVKHVFRSLRCGPSMVYRYQDPFVRAQSLEHTQPHLQYDVAVRATGFRMDSTIFSGIEDRLVDVTDEEFETITANLLELHEGGKRSLTDLNLNEVFASPVLQPDHSFSLKPALLSHGRLPDVTPWLESVNEPLVYFAGGLAHGLDYRRSNGGFVRGFRHSCNFLHRHFEMAHHGRRLSVQFPSGSHTRGGSHNLLFRDLPAAILQRLSRRASSLHHMHGVLCDIIIAENVSSIDDKRGGSDGDVANAFVDKVVSWEYFEGIPLRMVTGLHFAPLFSADSSKWMSSESSHPQNWHNRRMHESETMQERHVFIVTMEYGRAFQGRRVFGDYRRAMHPDRAHESRHLHPVIRYMRLPRHSAQMVRVRRIFQSDRLGGPDHLTGGGNSNGPRIPGDSIDHLPEVRAGRRGNGPHRFRQVPLEEHHVLEDRSMEWTHEDLHLSPLLAFFNDCLRAAQPSFSMENWVAEIVRSTEMAQLLDRERKWSSVEQSIQKVPAAIVGDLEEVVDIF